MMNLVPEKHKLQHSTLINLSNYFDNRLAWFSISFPSPELGPSRLIAITGALEKRSNTAGFVLRRLLISPQYCHLVINEALLLLQPHRELRHGRRTSGLASVINCEVWGELIFWYLDQFRGNFSKENYKVSKNRLISLICLYWAWRGVYFVQSILWCLEDNCPEQPLHHVPAAPTDFVIRREVRAHESCYYTILVFINNPPPRIITFIRK